VAHHHFTRDDRVLLVKLKTAGLTNRSIARILGFHPSSVGRELRRGVAPTATGYDIQVARKRNYRLRLDANQQHRRLHEKQAVQLTALLRQYYSPDQAGKAVGLSHATVYRWLWALPKATVATLWQYLRHKRLRRKYGTKRREQQREIAKKRWIDVRPQTVNDRLFYGHWEGDTVRGKDNTGHLVTLVERKSGYLLAGYIPRATKEAFRECAEQLLAPLPGHLKRSLTLDNGTEMADFEELERHTNMTVYFAHPYHSWERGSNENTNGLLRQFFPKGSSFAGVTKEQVDLAVNLLNTRPRKRHDYRSPAELLKPYVGVAI